jgi:hypothetical protein
MRNKGELPACSESAELTSKLAELITACLESARPTTQSAKPTASTACLESARPTFQSTKLTASASARVSLADFQSAKLTFPVLAAVDASSDDSAPIVDCSLEMKSNIIQIKDLHFSNMINKVENTNILLKFQSGQTISISASIRDIIANNCKRLIENGIIFADDKTNSDSIGQHIVSYGKANSANLSKLRLSKSSCKGVPEWIDVESDPFIALL